MVRNITINITAKSIALALVACALVWMLVVFDKILFILFLAVLLAIAIDPLVDHLERWRLPRALSILIVYLLLLGVLAAVGGLLLPVLVAEFNQLSTSLPLLVQQVLDAPQTFLSQYAPGLGRIAAGNDLARQLSGQLGSVAANVGGLLVELGRTLTTVVISTFLVLVVGFFFAVDARFAPRVIARFFPPTYRDTAATLARQIGGRLGHWVRAQLLVGLFFGTTFGIGLALLHVPYAVSLGVAGAVLELIPYIGGAIVTVIAMIVALSVSPWLPLAVLGLELVVANIESHIVYPKLVGEIVGLHPLTIIVALFLGAEAKGVLGALLAVPVAVVVQVLFDYFYRFDDGTTVTETTDPTEPVASAPELRSPVAQR